MLKSINIFEKEGKDKIYCRIREKGDTHSEEAYIFLNRIFSNVSQYIDSDIIQEITIQFHPRFWEIYLASSLMESDLNLEKSTSRDGPDICVKSNCGGRIWVEAVTSSSGNAKDAIKELEFGIIRDVPDDEIKLRILNSFSEKNRKYLQYLKNGFIEDDEPYIIGINAAQVPSSRRELEIPRIVRSLLPFGYLSLHIGVEDLSLMNTSYEYQGEVIKISGSSVDTTSFLNHEYSGISAVIYSCDDIFNHPTEISRSLLLFHNPLARNPLPLGFLKKGSEYWVMEDCTILKKKSWNA